MLLDDAAVAWPEAMLRKILHGIYRDAEKVQEKVQDGNRRIGLSEKHVYTRSMRLRQGYSGFPDWPHVRSTDPVETNNDKWFHANT